MRWWPVALATAAFGLLALMLPRSTAPVEPDAIFAGLPSPPKRPPGPMRGGLPKDGAESFAYRWSPPGAPAPAGDAERDDELRATVLRLAAVQAARGRFEAEIGELRASRFQPLAAPPGGSPNLVVLRPPGGGPLAFVMRENNLVVSGDVRVGAGRWFADEADARAKLEDMRRRLRKAIDG